MPAQDRLLENWMVQTQQSCGRERLNTQAHAYIIVRIVQKAQPWRTDMRGQGTEEPSLVFLEVGGRRSRGKPLQGFF